METTEEQRIYYAGLYVMKMLDVDPKEGGVQLPVVLPPEWYPLEDAIEKLVMQGLVAIHRRKGRYELTAQGIDLLGRLIDEAEGYIEEFDDLEVEETVQILEKRNVDMLRVRFLWGWYDGEFDDLVEFQRVRGIEPVEEDWASFLLSPEFYDDLTRDFEGD